MSLRRDTWVVLTKLVLAVVTSVLVVHFNIVSRAAVAAAFTRPGFALTALSLVVLGAHINVLRWHLLLRWQGSPLGFGRTWQISYISYFLGSFLPGGLGGDALRALYLHRECPETRLPAIVTIVLDRFLGLAAVLIMVLMLACAMPAKVGTPVLASLVLIAAGLTVAMIALVPLIAWFLPWLRWLPLPHVVRGLERLSTSLMGALEMWRGRPRRVLICLGLAVLSHVCVAQAIVLLARASGVHALSVLEIYFSGILAVLANQLPLTPGGLGVGETAFAQICRLLSSVNEAPAYGSAIFAFRVVTLLSFLPGSVALITFRHGGGHTATIEGARSIADSTASTPASSSSG